MKCPVCGSPRVYRHMVIRGAQIFQCRRCFLAFIDPKTPRKATGHIYDLAQYKRREGQFRRRFEKIFAVIDKYRTGKQALEVGAGFGLFSSLLSKKGYEVTALEPYVRPEYLKGTSVLVVKKPLHEFAADTIKKFDVIVLNDVLEHVDNVKKTAQQLKKLLRKRGILFIQTPNYRSYMAEAVHNWSWWMVEDHRFFFSEKSLALLFNKQDWTREYYGTYENFVDFKKNLDGNFKPGQWWAKRLFFAWWIPYYFVMRGLMWGKGQGGLITAVYRKK